MAEDHTVAESSAGWPRPTLLSWCFGTFHAVTLTVVGVLSLHLGGSVGDLLQGLSTAVGFAAFLFLWGLSMWTATAVLQRVTLFGPTRSTKSAILTASAVWGGVTGASFLAGVVLTIAVNSAGALPTLGLLLILAFVFALAFLVGALVGIVFGLLDLGLLALARWLVPAAERELDEANAVVEPADSAATDDQPTTDDPTTTD
ncbi:hypothetical protein [Haloarchaeobius sp. DFWS5]|uniref:hypothetical protein n=1 Tax=Haloarchaeobius sp. DFWS5 TaxID=3446114 RepID=UPI003EBD3725